MTLISDDATIIRYILSNYLLDQLSCQHINMPNILKKMKSSFQQRRDQFRRIIGRYLFDIKKESTTQQKHLQRIVIVRWDAKLGDSIVSSWLLREFKKRYPSASIEVIAPSAMADMFKRYFGADIIHICPKRPSYRYLKTLAAKIGKTDLLIHFSKKLKMKDLYFINNLECTHVAGLDDELNCINIKLGDKTRGDHFSDKFLELANIYGIANPNKQYVLPYNQDSVKKIATDWPRGVPVIAINPYGSSRSRKLTTGNIARLVNILKQSLPTNVKYCLLFSPETKDEVLHLSTKITNTFCCKESNSIGDLIAQLSLSDGVISVDTATIHIAACLNKPILGLYNPDMENFSEWGPNTEKSTVIFSQQKNPFDINTLQWDKLTQPVESWWMLTQKTTNTPRPFLNEVN